MDSPYPTLWTSPNGRRRLIDQTDETRDRGIYYRTQHTCWSSYWTDGEWVCGEVAEALIRDQAARDASGTAP